MSESRAMHVWGVRGSTPVTASDMAEYGGNTSCISVASGNEIIVFDAGSGLLQLGSVLKAANGPKRVHIFLSHLHMDHVLGLFGFPLLHDPNAEIHLYGEAKAGVPFRGLIEGLVRPPYWPLGIRDFQARIEFHEIAPEETVVLPGSPDTTVRTMRGNHPNLSLLCRLDAGRTSVVYALDCEMDAGILPELTDFARDSKVLIWDANFTVADLQEGWGHSTWEQGVALRRTCGAETVLMTHYCWTYTDQFLREQEQLAAKADRAVRFAKEGMEILL